MSTFSPQCSTTCGEGSQARSVECVWRQRREKKRSLAAPVGVCSNAEKPDAKRICNEDNCALSRKGH